MRRLAMVLCATAFLAGSQASPANADFGLHDLGVTFTPSMQAGSHPFEMTTSFVVNSVEEGGFERVDGAVRNLEITQPEGFTGNPTAVPRCSTLDFLTRVGGIPGCADATAVGTVLVTLAQKGEEVQAGPFAVFNLEPSPGAAAKLGFWVDQTPQAVELRANPDPPYNIVASLANISQVVEVVESDFTLWGNPADPVHDADRGRCVKIAGDCPANIPVKPLVTIPRSCSGPLRTTFEATSWWTGHPLEPGPPAFFQGIAETPPGATGCGKLDFALDISAQPTTDHAESPTGLDFELDIDDDGIANPTGIAQSDMQKAVVTLPEGMTINPSQAEGLLTCAEKGPNSLETEAANSEPGEGCPQASKVGTVEVETPILENEILRGELFVATPYQNPFGSLLALYMVIKDPELGIVLKLPGKVEPDPVTGQIVTTFDDLPQQPVSHLRLHLREGGRSPLVSPPACGTYTTVGRFTPSANPAQVITDTSDFQITHGVGGGPCPPAGPSPFDPGFSAGTINSNAGSFSPFHTRLTRRDGDQDLTRFDASLPPGMLAKIAGVSICPDDAIAAAKAKTGTQELASSSCPASSEIGRLLGGAGVGSQLTYVEGKIYLAGPFGGGPLSIVEIVPAVAGPFDVGSIVVRQALQVNPRTAEVSIDGARSDPIPHILAGIPLRVRDIRAYVDRPEFTLNPTSCKRMQIVAQLWGGGLNAFSLHDDAPVSRRQRFQAAACASLGFAPRLNLLLKGGAKRGDHPKLRGTYRPRPGHANLRELALRFPRSAFLDQGHIRTICTRVQFAADACPSGAVYGKATVVTPLLEEPLAGPVYLRSSSSNLPDLVFDLHGLVDFEAVFRIDSRKGGIRATLRDAPDAPITKAIVEMQGGRKGLIVNSRNLCLDTAKADARLTAHSGKQARLRPVVRSSACKGKPTKRK